MAKVLTVLNEGQRPTRTTCLLREVIRVPSELLYRPKLLAIPTELISLIKTVNTRTCSEQRIALLSSSGNGWLGKTQETNVKVYISSTTTSSNTRTATTYPPIIL